MITDRYSTTIAGVLWSSPFSVIITRMDKKYIIFDFDGTLANTNDIIVASWQAVFERYLGHRMPRQDIEATFGETLKYSVGRLVPDEDVDEVIAYYRAYQDAHNDEIAVYVFEGVRELIEELRARGCTVGVATSRTTYSFHNYMKKFGMDGEIEHIVTMDDVTRHKPDPESLLVCLSKITGLPADDIPEEMRRQAVMIGDTKYDIGCANNAGIDSVLVGWSHYVDMEDMEAHGFAPTHVIGKPCELLEII